MRTPRFAALLLPALAVAWIAAHATPARAQCPPAACTATPVVVGFESLVPGAPVEGLGAVHPLLNITSVAWPFAPSCGGPAFAIGVGVTPASYGTGSSTTNGCLDGAGGFGDSTGCVLEYDFTFSSGVEVTCFSIRMLDYGDLYPFGTAAHQVALTAFDASNAVVDQDLLNTFGAVDLTGGDACTAGPNGSGDHFFTVTGTGIVRVRLSFDGSPDPNVGFDDISFCAIVGPTSARGTTWGALKSHYR
jgi:hypothetical protein